MKNQPFVTPHAEKAPGSSSLKPPDECLLTDKSLKGLRRLNFQRPDGL
jgi:hypothetical protein